MRKGLSIKDKGYMAAAFKPAQLIVYCRDMNQLLLECLQRYPVHYANVIRGASTTSVYGGLLDYVEECTQHMPYSDFQLSTKIYWILHEWQDFPICENPSCNVRLIVDKDNRAFRLKLNDDGILQENWPRHCCPICAQMNPLTKTRIIQTVQDRYHVDNVFQDEAVKEKCRQQHLKNLGVDVPAKSKSIIAKMQKTCQERYGVDNPWKLDKVLQLAKDPKQIEKRRKGIIRGNLEKYGVPWFVMTNEYREKCKLNEGISREEKLILEIISAFDANVKVNVFDVIPPMQLDIFLPDKKIAFEFNGTYFHSIEKRPDSIDYHLKKTKRCEDIGVKLVHIWEDELEDIEKLREFVGSIINSTVMFPDEQTLMLDRSKFNKCWKHDGYTLVKETAPKLIVREKRGNKDKYHVSDCGMLIYRKK